MKNYLIAFFLSMVPIIELRGGLPLAMGLGLSFWQAMPICILGNILPMPFIYYFARKILLWGADKKYIGKAFRFFLEKGERGGQKLTKAAGRGGLFVALMLFVGIPLPGTGAWTGCLAATLLDMDFGKSVLAVLAGVLTAGVIMGAVSLGAAGGLALLFG